MSRYPYTCLEQQVSRAVALGDERRWREIADTLPGLLDRDGLLKYFPTLDQGSEVLTAYVLAIAQEAGRALPADVQSRAEAGLAKFVKGAIARRSDMPTADLSLRKLAAVEALARHGAVDAALLDSIAVEPNLWPTSAVLDWWSVLRRMPAIANRDARLKEAEQIVRARLNVQGTTHGLFHRAHRQSLVADGLGRRQCAAPRPVPRRRRPVEGRGAAPDARGARAPAPRRLGHDGGQCLGRARRGEVLARVRGHPRRGDHHRDPRRSLAPPRLGAGAQGRRARLPVAARAATR